MPQISSNISSVPAFIDFLGDHQIKCSGSQTLKLSRNVIDLNTKEMNLNATNCEKFNLIGEVLSTETIHNAEKELPLSSNKNINIEHEKASGNKPNTTYLCHKCKTVFNARATFEVHYKQAYNERPIYTCQICEKQMKNKRSYQRHYNRHSSSQKFSCTICSKIFTQERILKQHETVHNLEIAKSCTECKEEFFDLVKFKAHRRSHHAQSKAPQSFQCSDCGKLMKNRSSLSMHIKIHSNDRQYGCMICEQKFVQKINLINHVKVHNTVKTHSCGECGKSFVGQSQLLRHNIQHTNVRSFECETCKKMYKTKRDLKLHLMVHAVQRPHKCGTCDKTFLSTSKLKQHLNIHSGNRPFKCNFCPKDFTNFPNWLKHTRRRHKVDHKTGEKLMVMPNFLNKSNKAKSVTKNKSPNIIPAEILLSKADNHQMDTSLEVKSETALKMNDVVAGDTNRLLNGLLTEQLTVSAGVSNNEYKTQLTESSVHDVNSSDLSTITVNNRTLPLNTSDDLERAASLLMQQTLGLEDDIEYVNVKPEPFEPLNFENNQIDGDINRTFAIHYNDFALHSQMDFQSNYRSMNPNDLDFVYSYCPQSTQCDFRMMPLPPINTVKRKLKTVETSPTIFTSMTNV